MFTRCIRTYWRADTVDIAIHAVGQVRASAAPQETHEPRKPALRCVHGPFGMRWIFDIGPSLAVRRQVKFLGRKEGWATDPPEGHALDLRLMPKAARIILGLVIVGLALYGADLATRDCTVGLYVYDNCMWVWIRTHLGLPSSRLLRMVTMEFVGIALASVLYLTFKHVFPFRRTTPIPRGPSRPETPAPPPH